MVKVNTNNPNPNLPTEMCLTGESCGKLIFPKRYSTKVENTAIQIAKNTSRSNQCASNTKSAWDKNLKANASSKNPKTTFTVFNHPPDFGKEFIHPGSIAKSTNGMAIAKENPNIPTMGAIPPLEAASTNKEPTIGPVQLKDTMANAKAIKNIPAIPPLSACLSTLLAQELGSIISKAPKKEAANTINITKNIILKVTLVESAFRASAPKIAVTKVPNTT